MSLKKSLSVSYHKIKMVWLGKDLKTHLIPIPCHGQGHLPLYWVAQNPIPPHHSLHYKKERKKVVFSFLIPLDPINRFSIVLHLLEVRQWTEWVALQGLVQNLTELLHHLSIYMYGQMQPQRGCHQHTNEVNKDIHSKGILPLRS